ncbi:MAG: VOC family protein [Acidimicrobiales bacterium]|jgi:predicted enzyme related to lactoylglutathione lyase
MASLRYVTIDCTDSKRLASFWAAALDWAVVYDEADGALVAGPSGVYPQLYLQPVPEPKTAKNRAHVDLETVDIEGEIGQLCALGAAVISTGSVEGRGRSAVMGDPEGNEFCLSEVSSS